MLEKKRLFQILSRADRTEVIRLGKALQEKYPVVVVKQPEKTLAMIKMREPVQESLFYLGEVIVTEAMVTLQDTVGTAVCMGDDFEKTLYTAVIDAAENCGVFTEEAQLIAWEKQQQTMLEKENAMLLQTKVDFHSMDTEAMA